MLHEPIASEFIAILPIDYFDIVVDTQHCNVIFFFVIYFFSCSVLLYNYN